MRLSVSLSGVVVDVSDQVGDGTPPLLVDGYRDKGSPSPWVVVDSGKRRWFQGASATSGPVGHGPRRHLKRLWAGPLLLSGRQGVTVGCNRVRPKA
jgi:hypothetical protein